jgi:hypothetical protein
VVPGFSLCPLWRHQEQLFVSPRAMTDKDDPYYGALLIEEARLHLGTVMAGQDSEPFFVAMLKIVEIKAYLGYTTIKNKKVQLKGIKDFLQSVYYGLGIKDFEGFIANVVKSSLKERSRNKYAHQFIEWLKEQDPVFCFPPEYFEYRRVNRMIFYNKRMQQRAKLLSYKWARFIYNTQPELLSMIGYDRKYKTVEACYYGEGFEEKRQILKPIKTYQNPTEFQIGQLADSLFERLGKAKTAVLASELLARCNARSINKNTRG